LKKVLLSILVITVIITTVLIPASGAENLCDKLSVVSDFHNLYSTYENPDIDIGGVLEREVKPGELYSPSTIIASTDLIYVENPNKYTLVKPPKCDSFDFNAPLVIQRPYGQYICVPRNDYFDFVKKHFEVSDSLLNELQNFKVKDFSTEYSEKGTAIYNPADDTFIVPALDDRNTTLQKNTIRQFVGYVENGGYYDVYLKHSKIENDYMKYTVAYTNSVIKYISNIRVNTIPQNIIKPGDSVPDNIVTQTTPESLPESTTESVAYETVPEVSEIEISSVEATVDETSSETKSGTEESSIETESGTEESSDIEKSSNKITEEKNLNILPFVIIGVAVITIVGAAVWYFMLIKKNNSNKLIEGEPNNETD